MGYLNYLKKSNKNEIVQNIKEDIINSKDFVNIFLSYTNNKPYDDTDVLFNDIVEDVAIKIANANVIEE